VTVYARGGCGKAGIKRCGECKQVCVCHCVSEVCVCGIEASEGEQETVRPVAG
jgi:hypothetical protein